MFFTRVGAVIAWIGFVLSSFQVVTGLLIALGTPTPEDRQAAARYFFGSANIGEEIDQGFLYLLISVLIGILVEISRALHSK